MAYLICAYAGPGYVSSSFQEDLRISFHGGFSLELQSSYSFHYVQGMWYISEHVQISFVMQQEGVLLDSQSRVSRTHV